MYHFNKKGHIHDQPLAPNDRMNRTVFDRFFRNRNRSILGSFQNGPGGQICIFHLFWGVQGVPPGVPWGAKLNILNFELLRHVRG